MKFAQDDTTGKYVIRSYQAGKLTINDTAYERSVIIMPERLIDDWQPQSFEELTTEHVLELGRLEPEILLLGTGATLRFPPPESTGRLGEQGIGIEVMDTAAACRTYNILVSEDRRVVAALLMI